MNITWIKLQHENSSKLLVLDASITKDILPGYELEEIPTMFNLVIIQTTNSKNYRLKDLISKMEQENIHFNHIIGSSFFGNVVFLTNKQFSMKMYWIFGIYDNDNDNDDGRMQFRDVDEKKLTMMEFQKQIQGPCLLAAYSAQKVNENNVLSSRFNLKFLFEYGSLGNISIFCAVKREHITKVAVSSRTLVAQKI